MKKKTLLACALAAATVLAACGGGGSDDSAVTQNTTPPTGTTPSIQAGATANLCGTATPVAEILAKLNAARATARGCGFATHPAAPALAWNARLAAAAERHSQDMASHSLFSHTGSDGSSVADRASAAGYTYWMLGENISGGQATADAAIAVWLSSPDHCANLMNPGYKDAALACTHAPGSAYQNYWTLVLGAQN